MELHFVNYHNKRVNFVICKFYLNKSENKTKTLALSLSSCVTWAKLLNLSMPQSPHLKSGDSNSTYLTGLLEELNNLMH